MARFKDESDEPEFLAELYDTSDVSWEMRQPRGRKEIWLFAKAPSGFNLIKFYLALKEYVEKIEQEIGVLEDADARNPQ